MKCLVVIAVVIQAAIAGQVNVQSPYLNPAGVTYIHGSAGLRAAPLGAPLTPLSNAYTTSTYYGNGHFFRGFAHQAAPVLTHQVAAVAAPAAAVVPTVHHVPGVADVPVTRIQAQPGFIHKEVDVAKPAVKTSRYELRRPAIQKEFYDIEERVVVRPAGSALVELDQPHSKVHKSSVVSPLAPAHVVPQPGIIAASPAPPSFITSPGFGISSTPGPIGPIDQGIASDDDSVVIEARRFPQPQRQAEPQFRSQFEQQPIFRSQFEQQPQLRSQFEQPQFRSQFEQQPQLRSQFEQPQFRSQFEQQSQFRNQAEQQQQFRSQFEQQSQFRSQFEQQPQFRTQVQSQPQPQLRSQQQIPEFRTQIQPQIPQVRTQIQPQAVVRSRPELRSQDQSGNQQRLIELLTAREGVADVGFNGPAFRSVGDAGQVRARVLSAQVASRDAPATGERVNTRRVVVSRPIETVEEVDVLEPVTKLERLAVQHPAVFKTAHVGYERVPTSVPVLGKALAPLAPVGYGQSPLYYH